MEKNKLGLPLVYSKLAEYYDVLNQGNDASINRTIESILREHKVKTVLDLTCGTGSQVFSLAKCGYEVAGVDLSPALLALARDKAQQGGVDVSLIEGDMRTIQIYTAKELR